MIKRLATICFLMLFVGQSIRPDDAEQSKKLALEIIASLSEDIVALMASKQAKDPELTKVCVVQLITNLADFLATVIIKIKERKNTRTVHDDISQADYDYMLDGIVTRLCVDLTDKQ